MHKNKNLKQSRHSYQPKPEFAKRAGDVILASIALIITSPIIIAVTIILKLQGGPIIYRSRRYGAEFKKIDILKFRTMDVDADKKVDQIQNLNEYNGTFKIDENEKECETTLIGDDNYKINETNKIKEDKNTPVFMKFKSDPRVTKFGKLLRKTSIDELPQLFNILKGDLSLVGNRPLPLLEAEKLTSDDKAARFLAPAGLTGLWQVTQRGTDKISQEDRVRMDNEYAKNRSFIMDMKIILLTFKALIQNENN
jgi:lipopolysaccharide/colanic/teichoic acid biosynthesis glycosyltransferase